MVLPSPYPGVGGAAYARVKHPAVYWVTVGLLISTARLLASYGSVMEARGLGGALPAPHRRLEAIRVTEPEFMNGRCAP